MHDNEKQEEWKDLARELGWCNLVMGKGSLWSIQSGAMTTELTTTGTILKLTYQLLKSGDGNGQTQTWRAHAELDDLGGLSHNVCCAGGLTQRTRSMMIYNRQVGRRE